MKLLSTTRRRLAFGLSMACAAVLAPTAALAASSGPAAPAGPSVAAASCHSAATLVWHAAEGNGAAGTVFFEIELSNVGHATCTLFGYPGVSELNIHGHQVGLPARHSGPKILVTLHRGDTAHFVLAVTDAGAVCGHPVKGSTLRVFPPGQRAAQLLQFPAEMCPHRSTMHVDAVHPGTGIPGFSAR
jgi:Domain of unknown function (DUF4232)